MNQSSEISGDELSQALRRLGVNFILGGQGNEPPVLRRPVRLLAASLAASHEARLRLSLIPLLLEHPEFAAHVRAAARQLTAAERLTLQCYFSAAVWLGQKYKISLPDYFSRDMGLQPGQDADENLRQLAKRHAELSGAQVNWLGTYQHAAQVWEMGHEFQKAVA